MTDWLKLYADSPLVAYTEAVREIERLREALALLPDAPDHWDEFTGDVRLTEDQWKCVQEARAILPPQRAKD